VVAQARQVTRPTAEVIPIEDSPSSNKIPRATSQEHDYSGSYPGVTGAGIDNASVSVCRSTERASLGHRNLTLAQVGRYMRHSARGQQRYSFSCLNVSPGSIIQYPRFHGSRYGLAKMCMFADKLERVPPDLTIVLTLLYLHHHLG
jgi:hypothetical protein